jgi:hypothetical protein
MATGIDNERNPHPIESDAEARAASSLLPMLVGGLVLIIIGMTAVMIFA